MADSLTERCREYCKNVDIGKMGNPYFFPSPYGGHYSEATIYSLFREVLRQARISHLGRGKGPRIHDLRYPNLNKIQTFFKRCLIFRDFDKKGLDFFLMMYDCYHPHRLAVKESMSMAVGEKIMLNCRKTDNKCRKAVSCFKYLSRRRLL